MYDDSCPFCKDIGSTVGGRNVIVLRTDNISIFADLSPISPGHMLICPVVHHTSFANAPSEIRKAAFEAISCIRKFYQSIGKSCVVGEHGTGIPGGSTNACCEHAHLHIVPTAGSVDMRFLVGLYVNAGGPPNIMDNEEDLAAYKNQSYSLLVDGDDRLLIWRGLKDFYPQFFRNAVCSALRYDDSDLRRLWQTSREYKSIVDSFQIMQASLNEISSGKKVRDAKLIGKLVRDRIPEIVTKSGRGAIYRSIDFEQLALVAPQKLIEELNEFLENGDLIEAADLLEALILLFRTRRLEIDTVDNARLDKALTHGTFSAATVLEVILEDK